MRKKQIGCLKLVGRGLEVGQHLTLVPLHFYREDMPDDEDIAATLLGTGALLEASFHLSHCPTRAFTAALLEAQAAAKKKRAEVTSLMGDLKVGVRIRVRVRGSEY